MAIKYEDAKPVDTSPERSEDEIAKLLRGFKAKEDEMKKVKVPEVVETPVRKALPIVAGFHDCGDPKCMYKKLFLVKRERNRAHQRKHRFKRSI